MYNLHRLLQFLKYFRFIFYYLTGFYQKNLKPHLKFFVWDLLIVGLIWHFLPSSWKTKIVFFVQRYSIYIHTLNLTQRNVFCFLFWLFICFVSLLLVHFFLIRFSFVLLFLFCFFIFVYIGGGALCAFICNKQNKSLEDKYQTFFDQYPFFKFFFLNYEFLFNSQSGKICNFVSFILFWYLNNIHPLLSFVVKFKLTCFRFFCYSISSWINIIIFLTVVPSFIGEGLDSSYYFSFLYFWSLTLEQRQQIMQNLISFLKYLQKFKIIIFVVFYGCFFFDFFNIIFNNVKEKLNDFMIWYCLKRLKYLIFICTILGFVYFFVLGLFNKNLFTLCLTFVGKTFKISWLYVGSPYLFAFVLVLWFVQVFLYLYCPQKFKNNWEVSFIEAYVYTVYALYSFIVAIVFISILVDGFKLDFYVLSIIYNFLLEPQPSLIFLVSRLFLLVSFMVCFYVFFKAKFFVWWQGKVLKKREKLEQKLQDLHKKQKLSSNYVLPSTMFISPVPQKQETSEDVVFVVGTQHTEEYSGAFFERFLMFQKSDFEILLCSWFTGDLCSRSVRYDVARFPIPRPEHPGYQDLSRFRLTKQQIMSHITDINNPKQDLLCTMHTIEQKNVKLALVKKKQVDLEMLKSAISPQAYKANVQKLAFKEEEIRGNLRILEFVFYYIIEKCPLQDVHFYLPRAPLFVDVTSLEAFEHRRQLFGQETPEMGFQKNLVFLNKYYELLYGIKFRNFAEFKVCQVFGPRSFPRFIFWEQYQTLEKNKISKKSELLIAFQNAKVFDDKRNYLGELEFSKLNLNSIDLTQLNEQVYIEDLLKKAKPLEKKQRNTAKKIDEIESLMENRVDELNVLYEEQVTKAKKDFQEYLLYANQAKEMEENVVMDTGNFSITALRKAGMEEHERRLVFDRPRVFLDSRASMEENAEFLTRSRVFLEKSKTVDFVFSKKYSLSCFKISKDEYFFLENSNIQFPDTFLNSLL